MAKRVNVDAEQRNADWIKVAFWDLPEDKATFLAVIGGESQLEHFLSLPAAEAMPAKLKMELGIQEGEAPTETSPHRPHPKTFRVVPL